MTASMPVVPFLEVGLAPLLQWILLPPIALWIVRRQLTGSNAVAIARTSNPKTYKGPNHDSLS